MSPPEPRAEPEVSELDVSVGVDEDVVRLDVAVDEPHRVNALNGASQFGNVKSGMANSMI